MLFEKNGVIFISMPGVPHEMKGMTEEFVLPYLQKAKTLPSIIHKTLLTAGVGESFLADLIQPWEEALPENIKLAYLPNYGMVRLRLSAIGFDTAELENAVSNEFEKLQTLVKEHLVTTEDEPMEKVVAKLLLQLKETMATAESCTGGYIAHLITSVAGSSAYYKGSVISYANEVKENMLGVKHDTLMMMGAVSEETVREMVTGTLQALKVDYAVVTSGIMGPDGGSDEKPVGTVWIAAGNKEKIETIKLNLRFDREKNISIAANNALNFLRKFIVANG